MNMISNGTRTGVVLVAILAGILVPFAAFGKAADAWAIEALMQLSNDPRLAGLIIGLLVFDVVAPVPSSMIATLSGTLLGLTGGSAVAWCGLMLGSAIGYGIGAGLFIQLSGRSTSQDDRRVEKLSGATLGAVALTRGVPVFAEAMTLLAGAHRLPFLPFIGVSAIANLGVAVAYAYVGAMAANVNSFLLAFGGSIGLPAIALLIHRVVTRRRRGR